MPSSSATCSTTTVSTIASSSERSSHRCSMGRRNSTSRVGWPAGAADERGQRHGLGAPVVGDLRGVLDGVLHEPEPVLPAVVDLGHDAQGEVVEPLAAGCAAPAARARRGSTPGPAHAAAAPVAVARASLAAGVVHAASLIRVVGPGRYRLPRESRPPLFAHRLWPHRGQHADLRVRRPDGGARSRWRPTPSRTPMTSARSTASASRPPGGGRCCGWLRTPPRRGPASDDLLALADAVREAARPAPQPLRPPPAAETGRETGRRGHLRVLSSD